MNLKALQAKLAALLAESDVIAVKAEPSAEDVARIKAIPAEMRDVKSQIEAAQEIESIRAWQSQAAPMLSLADPSNGGAATKAADAPTDVSPTVKMWYAHRFKSAPAGAEQIAKELYGNLAPNGSYEQLLFDKHQAFMKYVRFGVGLETQIARAIVLTPQQIFDAAAGGVTTKAIRAQMIEGSDELGGFLVPEDFRERIIARLPGMTVVRPRATVETTSSDVMSMIRETGGTSRYPGGVRVTWVDETPTANESQTNATFGALRLSIYTVMASVYLSKNLLEDSMVDLGGRLTSSISTASAIDEDEQFLISAGAGKPQGILNGATANVGPHNADITIVNSGSAAALTGDGLIKMPFGVGKQYRSSQACWVMNKATLQASRLLKDGQGRYLYPQSDLTGAAIPTSLLGYTIEESEAMPDVAANVHAVIFGDLGAYTIADRIGMSIQRYDDSVTADLNAVKFVARRRLGGQVIEGWRLVVQKTAA